MKNTKSRQFVDPNPVEAFREIGSEITKAGKNAAKDSFSDMWDQLLGLDTSERSQKSGDLKEGEAIDFSKKKVSEQKEKTPDFLPAIDYRREVIHAETQLSRKDKQEMQAQIEQILVELKRIVTASAELEVEHKDLVVEQRIEKPGKYHLSFFQWMLTVVRSARMRIEDSAAWLQAFKSKKAKQGYWKQFKDKGTSFSLNNERSLATQAG
ncbi:MAG: hypothetical protein HYT10_02865 [Candidatus Levybacteria bacterium]|nr:hypothetical protein [Candidatus Levybacteria bacterium]